MKYLYAIGFIFVEISLGMIGLVDLDAVLYSVVNLADSG